MSFNTRRVLAVRLRDNTYTTILCSSGNLCKSNTIADSTTRERRGREQIGRNLLLTKLTVRSNSRENHFFFSLSFLSSLSRAHVVECRCQNVLCMKKEKKKPLGACVNVSIKRGNDGRPARVPIQLLM